ncbi:MAG: hypothetical protein IGQ45_14660 [Cyanobacterium sp. T60_A2020_053]|nr:hypothetical protein [Cyanobacterium sp. T60_A2020_053]
MATSTLGNFSAHHEIWQNLKQAIAKTSGFQQWLQEQQLEVEDNIDVDEQVKKYLRSTLETLAY